MVRPRGFEPLTYGLEGRCSIQLSYERIWYQRGDSNPRPPAYETSALNQLSYPDLKPDILPKILNKVKIYNNPIAFYKKKKNNLP